MGLSLRIRGTRGSVVGVTVRLLQGCGELFRADHSWGGLLVSRGVGYS